MGCEETGGELGGCAETGAMETEAVVEAAASGSKWQQQNGIRLRG